jgi:hypothetical protein
MARWRGPRLRGPGLRPYTPLASPELGFRTPGIRYNEPHLRPSTLANEFGLGGIGYENVVSNTERLIRKLKQLLLYCESVAMDNPLGPTHEAWYGTGSGVAMGRAQAWALGRYVELLSVLEPLITSKALVLVEHPYGVDPLQDAPLPGPLRAERALLEEIDERIRPLRSLFVDEASIDEDFQYEAVIDMARALSLAGRSRALHAYAPSPAFQGALRTAQSVAIQILSEEWGFIPPRPALERELEVGRLDKLLAMEFPGLDNLPLSEIAAVRTGPEFTQLRRELGDALDRVLGDPASDDPEWGDRARQQLADELADSRDRFQRSIDKSPVLRRSAREAPRDFVLSFASVGTGVGLLQALVGHETLAAALAEAVVGSAITGALLTMGIVVGDYRRERRLPESAPRDRGALAAHRHLCVLSPPDPG